MTIEMNKVVVNFGSINIDYVYHVAAFVQPGETLSSRQFDTGLGGKGANQSVAIARAGGAVMHVGQLSSTDQWALKILQDSGVDTQYIKQVEQASGHAIIQVDTHGENAILLHGGANQSCDLQVLVTVLSEPLSSEYKVEYLLLQNECNGVGDAIDLAYECGIKVAFNPAPMTETTKNLPLHRVSLLVVNQVEAKQLWGVDEPTKVADLVHKILPDTTVVITLGNKGAALIKAGVVIEVPAHQVDAIDTTGAGDTFVGYLLTSLVSGEDDVAALQYAMAAAGLSVTNIGAIAAIPTKTEVKRFINA